MSYEDILTYSGDLEDLTSVKVMKLVSKHETDIAPRFEKNLDYYLGHQAIEDADRGDGPNARPVCNHAKDISDTAAGYFLGSPLSYSLSGHDDDEAARMAFERLKEALETATTDDDDQENALTLSICGRAYEYIYTMEGRAELGEKPIDPQNAFLVYDSSIEHRELFGVYYYKTKNEETGQLDTKLLVMTAEDLIYWTIPAGTEQTARAPELVEAHNLGQVPLVEYRNNHYSIGDFEQQIGLIDAYNEMTADRINDKAQFIDAVLVLYGAILGDTEEERDEAMTQLQAKKLLEMPEGTSAEYLVRQLDENGMEILRDALKEDIYTFSHVPNLTDENFAGNSSGVAMEYKLLGLEMLTKTKERWYRRGLRKRLEIFLHFLGIVDGDRATIRESEIDITFSRSLPKNLYEIAQTISLLGDKVSSETLLGLLPFVADPAEEAEAVKFEQDAAAEALRLEYETAGPLETGTPIDEVNEDGAED